MVKKPNRVLLAAALAITLGLLILLTHNTSPSGVLWPNSPQAISISHEHVLQHLKVTKSVTEDQRVFKDDLGSEILDFDRSSIKYIYPEVIDAIYNLTEKNGVDWSKYAYVINVISSDQICNAMMMVAELRQFNTRAQVVMLVRQEFLNDRDGFTKEYDTLTMFAIRTNAVLKPTEIIRENQNAGWQSRYLKLMAFNETEYDRVIYLDSDALLMKGNLDELFFLPPCKLAVSTAYWKTKRSFDQLNRNQIIERYDPKVYGFRPMTAKKRFKHVMKFIEDNVWTFVDPTTKRIPNIISTKHISSSDPESVLHAHLNKKNFYTNIYNNLPKYPTLEEFSLTNMLMVIEPSKELFESVQEAIKNKKHDENDLELLQTNLFQLYKVLSRQESRLKENLSFDQRYRETPDILIIPHQRYATITPELNTETNHRSYLADSHEQLFAHLGFSTKSHKPAYYEISQIESPGDHVFQNIKYLQFSDSPIPKPWFLQKPDDEYMSFRARCPTHADFQMRSTSSGENVVKPKHVTKDCSGGKNWERAHMLFQRLRKDVCGLGLIDADNHQTMV